MVQEGRMALSGEPSLDADTLLLSDSLVVAEPQFGLVLDAPAPEMPASVRLGGSEGVSFLLGGLFLLFLIIALRFRNNFKYVVSMFRNLVETRTRQNVFDDTVRETSLVVMLNILWCAGAGIVGFCVYQFFHFDIYLWEHRAQGMLMGMAIAVVYTLFLLGAYSGVGWIFSDRSHSLLWVKGFTVSQALMAPAFFLTALVAVCRPDIAPEAGVVTAAVFIAAKLVFIWKGYRIFFSQFYSWVLFLCYLCSLEIVPLILCYRIAVLLGEEF